MNGQACKRFYVAHMLFNCLANCLYCRWSNVQWQ